MYVLLSQKKVKELVITRELVERPAPPLEVLREVDEAA